MCCSTAGDNGGAPFVALLAGGHESSGVEAAQGDGTSRAGRAAQRASRPRGARGRTVTRVQRVDGST